MPDFHTPVIPFMDDGVYTESESLSMLESEKQQGVDTVYLTSHFYVKEELPDDYM